MLGADWVSEYRGVEVWGIGLGVAVLWCYGIGAGSRYRVSGCAS